LVIGKNDTWISAFQSVHSPPARLCGVITWKNTVWQCYQLEHYRTYIKCWWYLSFLPAVMFTFHLILIHHMMRQVSMLCFVYQLLSCCVWNGLVAVTTVS